MEHNLYPIITSALVDELHQRALIPKPTARGTGFRYSSSFGCGRQQGYAAFSTEPTEPMDEAGAWATGLGTIVHEALQDALSRRFKTAQFEFASQQGDISGSCDALISIHDIGSHYGGTHVLYELKTMGTYSFDKQLGWNRMRGTVKDGEGPALKAIAQAGMNALGIMSESPEIVIETIIMGSIGFEALSKNKAEAMGVFGVNRFLAEFDVPRSEWEPVALAEIDRMSEFSGTVQSGYLPDRWAKDDSGNELLLNPNGRAWQCDYCQFKSICQDDGEGEVRIVDSALTKRSA